MKICVFRLLRLQNHESVLLCATLKIPEKGKTELCSEWTKRELTLLSSAAFAQQHHLAWTMPWLRGTGSTAACVVRIPLVC